MKWFSGDIASAISQCTSQKAILLVYIKDNADMSLAMDSAIWSDEEVTTFFDDRLCVPLELAVDSVGGQQFSQIYPVLNVPSVYLVGSDGKIMEILPANTTKEQLLEKCETHLSKKTALATPSGAVVPQAGDAGAAASETSEAAAASPSGAAAGSAAAGSAAADAGNEETEEEINANTEYSQSEKDAKIKRARELIAIKKAQKAAEDKEKARNAEIGRRELGKGLNKLKQMKLEQEAKETREALRKDKEETRLAREKVKEQIARDREARAAKFQKEKADKAEDLKQRQQEKLQKEAEEAARIAAANSSNARIQFRMPDGSRINHTFDANENLMSVINFLATNDSNTMGRDFRLAVVYPRRVFTSDDHKSSLRDLSLVPSSALLVLPPAVGGDSPRPTSTSTGSITSLASVIFSPFLLIWSLIQNFLFASPQTPPSNPQQQPAHSPRSQGASRAPETGGARRRVGRLGDIKPDDEQNTYNGNSTQQM